MGKGKASTIYLLTVFLLAALFVLNLSLFYGLLLDRQAPAENMTRLVYAVMILGLSVLAVQAALVFRSMIAKLDKDRNMAEELAERINQMTVLDELTKTFNRRKFETVIEREVENARRYKTLISGIMFDIDGFKKINDAHGYKTGDRILYSLARFINRRIRKTDYLFRWRGGKFIILAPHIDLEKAAIFGEKIRKAVEAKVFGDSVKLTISLGVTQVSPNDSSEKFIQRIQAALSGAKEKGRNQLSALRAA